MHFEKMLPYISRTLSSEYYKELTAKKEKKEKKPHKLAATEERKKEIADHIRKHGRTSARKNLHCSEKLMDVVQGLMYLGKL